MKLRKIKLQDHPIFGDIEFDFTINDNAADTIIIAGQNGSGKTQLLEKIFSIPYPNDGRSMGSYEEYIFEFSDKELEEIYPLIDQRSEINKNEMTKIMKIVHMRSNGNLVLEIYFQIMESITGRRKFIKKINSNLFYTNQILKDKLKIIYSKAEITYNPNHLSTITSKKLDTLSDQNIISQPDLATEIQQLIIDVKNNDDAELSNWVDENPDKIPPEEIKKIGIKRFNNAFKIIFDELSIDRIKNEDDRKKVILKKGNKEIEILNLSSGEKQIIFRGAFLLKDKNSIKGCRVLIDEPEISLHPNWQKNILNFYKQLFTDSETGIQTSQIFITTHSPYVVHGISINDKIICLSSENGNIKVNYESEFPSIGPEIAIQQAFEIQDPIIEPTVFVEGKIDEIYLNTYLKANQISHRYKIKQIGGDINGKDSNSGKNALNQCILFARTNPSFFRAKTIILFDFDARKPKEDIQNVLVRCMPEDNSNRCNRGIENLIDNDGLDLKERKK